MITKYQKADEMHGTYHYYMYMLLFGNTWSYMIYLGAAHVYISKNFKDLNRNFEGDGLKR